ncbi:type 1 glutamine amidotransferase domain-containing protein [Polaribacter reichenbachii]|uniref:Glutamine amidotransferase n=1 Tax=Polaribacter reichenbachii TaxID=996801 RepID=A0A1B8U4D1_9FLAO|nr:type 1 glutamine amidotransferase domain-containing protein [Polaribacter reichenbachii]APZ47478.1 type 1 glutamine amidotransferase domain-containing protein [Polaribacter reichenbachii]AUC18117.1 type 1 glutamine amidotransferase domain-containing protein [Polaribacter reichenbachii]OBY66728.1 glutamine amidotransferase [Polaribacter reichenbachii]
MFKKYPIVKKVLLFLLSLLVILVCFGFWFVSLLPSTNLNIENTTVKDLPYLSENVLPKKGKILAVVTSTKTIGTTGKKTGYELTELSRAYYVFKANGYQVDVASTLGGKPRVIIDNDDMGAYDFAFLNDKIAQQKTNNTIAMKDVIADNYDAIYFVGGKGAMFDFPNDKSIQNIVKEYYESNKVIGAVCHGPAALVNVRLTNGNHLLENKSVSGFTNEEELLLIPDAKSIFPFLLQEKLTEQGANFNKGEMYLEQISQDKNLITGQNPWSTWALAEKMIEQLGNTPKKRMVTAEENAIKVLSIYSKEGKQKAKNAIENMINLENKSIDRMLLAQHTIVSVMKVEIGDFFNILNLLSFTKSCDSKIEKK